MNMFVSSYVILTLADWLICHKKWINFLSLTATSNPLMFFKLKLSNQVIATETHKWQLDIFLKSNSSLMREMSLTWVPKKYCT